MTIQSQILSKVPGIIHSFGTAHQPIPDWPSWNSRPTHQQVHGVAHARVEVPNQLAGNLDALYTYSLDLPIGVYTADCVPILLAHESGRSVAAVHAGWRGTYAQILRNLWHQLKSEGESPQEWVAAIGPSIGPCCYEVSLELAHDFRQKFSDLPAQLVSGSLRESTRMLDLPAINAEELRALGMDRVEILRNCTFCSQTPRFHSFRREGGGTRQWSTVQRTKVQ